LPAIQQTQFASHLIHAGIVTTGKCNVAGDMEYLTAPCGIFTTLLCLFL
jgi:hypothetical protein